MDNIDKKIKIVDRLICKDINTFCKQERGVLSQNILNSLRTFVEYISLKEYGISMNREMEENYENIQKANKYVKTKYELNFLGRFHKFLQISSSHYIPDEENAERLMLKYYEYMLLIKRHLKKRYNMAVLINITKFPIDLDPKFKEYYEKIAQRIHQVNSGIETDTFTRYYIHKVKPFFVNNEVYYEVTLTLANDSASKSDRIIAFSSSRISSYYSVNISSVETSIRVFGRNMPVKIIKNWKVSIRPCEVEHFAEIFGTSLRVASLNNEYRALMDYLTQTGLNLVEMIDLPDESYQQVKNEISEQVKFLHIFNILDLCKQASDHNIPGKNIIRFLLYRMNNRVIKDQLSKTKCELLSNLFFQYGCIPFDQMPFASSLLKHNSKAWDVFDSIDAQGHENEIFARHIQYNTQNNAQLYTPLAQLESFKNIDNLIKTYNGKLHSKHQNRKLMADKDYIFIKEYEQNAIDIINRLRELAEEGVLGYRESVDSWLSASPYQIDCEEKRAILRDMFSQSKLAMIYGSAGTGKSTLIQHISNFFNNKKKLYLAHTNPAVNNLQRKISTSNCTFKTITKFLSKSCLDVEYDLLIIDECSTVSNRDMNAVLEKAQFNLLVLVGDICQIAAIEFGDWFSLAKFFVPPYSIFELIKPYRSDNKQLLELWRKVRNLDDDITEHISKYGYSLTLDQSIFQHCQEDEIILCLNYDGLYGINNINRFLQCENKNPTVQWGIWTYKIGDPILFNESNRFFPLIYNNLKGKILDIKKSDDKIQFDIEIEKAVNELDIGQLDLKLVGSSKNGRSIIQFSTEIYKNGDRDDESNSKSTIPFQIAYAISIHKAQGLEYGSVKIVINDEVEEMITHSIFYTAITRAKEELKIYWSPECQNKVLKQMKSLLNQRDAEIISSKFGFKMNGKLDRMGR